MESQGANGPNARMPGLLSRVKIDQPNSLFISELLHALTKLKFNSSSQDTYFTRKPEHKPHL